MEELGEGKVPWIDRPFRKDNKTSFVSQPSRKEVEESYVRLSGILPSLSGSTSLAQSSLYR